MPERIACEYLLIRYVPDVVKGEFTNIGVILREVARPESLVVRFARNWTRAKALDRELDGDLLDAFEAELSQRIPDVAGDARPLLEVIRSSFSTCLQVTEPKACLAESLPAEMERLMTMYVEPLQAATRSRPNSRGALVLSMRRAFERSGAWELMRRNIAVAAYTAPGDPLRVDCGYRPNGTVRMFHAVSLDGDPAAAKVLAFTASPLREGVRRVDGGELQLTALVEALRSRERSEAEQEAYRFAVEVMERAGIRVATPIELEAIAETAARELRV